MPFCFFSFISWKLALSLTLRCDFYAQDFGAFTSPQLETSGSTKSGAQMVKYCHLIVIMLSFCIYLPIVLFAEACFFPAQNLSCLFHSVCLAFDTFTEQNITQGYLAHSANPHWFIVTLRPLSPSIAGSHTGN